MAAHFDWALDGGQRERARERGERGGGGRESKGGETHTHTHTLPLKASRLQLLSYNLQLTFLLNTGVHE